MNSTTENTIYSKPAKNSPVFECKCGWKGRDFKESNVTNPNRKLPHGVTIIKEFKIACPNCKSKNIKEI